MYDDQAVVCFAGVSGARHVTVTDLDVVVNALIKKRSSLVKATIEARLGHVGTVGAMLVEELITKLKSAMEELLPATDVVCV